MRVFKKLQAASMVSILVASFMFLIPGTGTSHADAHNYRQAQHFKNADRHAHHTRDIRQHNSRVSRHVVTTTSCYTPAGKASHHLSRHHKGKLQQRHYRPGKSHLARNSFKHHQKLRRHNFKTQRHAQRHIRHNLGLFAAMPGIIVNIPL